MKQTAGIHIPEHVPVRFLEWDTQFFGRRIASVSCSTLETETTSLIDQWCLEHAIECLYFLADAHDGATSVIAQESGFRFVDVRVTFESAHSSLETVPTPALIVRSFIATDVPALKDIARGGYKDSRFYFDGTFSPELCEALYVTWIDRSCEGYANHVFTAELNGAVVGFLTCHLLPDGETGQIGLVGVASAAKGQRVGSALIHAAHAYFTEQQVHRRIVVTQARNIPALRFYQKNGFLISHVQLWYHKWYSEQESIGRMTIAGHPPIDLQPSAK